MKSTSVIEINRAALESNIGFLHNTLNEKTVLSVVVKGNAYGHGIPVMLPVLQEMGVDHFSVYSSSEAMVAKEFLSENSTLMIMGFIFPHDYEWIIRKNIQFYVSSLVELNRALETTKRINITAQIHIEFETGMNRTGMSLAEIKEATTIIKNNQQYINVIGYTSHLAGAESIANDKRIKSQLKRFNHRIELMKYYGVTAPQRHIASSAATISYPSTRFELVRVGIMTYGYWPTKETYIEYNHNKKGEPDPLKRVLSWRSTVMAIKTVQMGQFIGYGLSYQAYQNMQIMIIPVGYSNGYSRSLSNNGHVLVKGINAPVISTVNMNMIICDISHIEGVAVGDEVVLIGAQDESQITFSSFAEMNNSLNYEILARLPGNIERKLVD
jgi:alanine racemase